jgi:hypothetical protein
MSTTYSEKDCAILAKASPLTFEKAGELASELGKTQRSIIAKAKSLGLDYIPKAKPKATGEKGITKAQILADIREKLNLPDREGDLTKAELETLLAAI